MKQRIRSFIIIIRDIMSAPLATYAASTAFFLCLSLLPFLLLLSFSLPYIGVGAEELISTIVEFTPVYVDDLVTEMIREAFERSATMAPVTAIIVLWSAAMSMFALSEGLRVAYGKGRARNAIVLRIFSMLYTILLLLLLLAAMLLAMFGKRFLSWTSFYSIPLPPFLTGLIEKRMIALLGVGIVLILMLYTFVAGNRWKPSQHLPGAVFTILVWSAFTFFFSLYLNHNSSYRTIYGSMAVIAVLQLWLYFSVYILLIGARLNLILIGRKK